MEIDKDKGMSEKFNLFETALNESFAKQVREAAKGMYQIYREFISAGFDKGEAMTLMIAMMQNGTKKDGGDND